MLNNELIARDLIIEDLLAKLGEKADTNGNAGGNAEKIAGDTGREEQGRAVI